ncbi:DUF6094 domain-containing protein (plasmid) [Clostridium beijerinckii]|uniref:DUF6094 domain-containing protein n=1 Tax=Clostridium beijerinckii TaxID=1520 RepID=UPI00222784D9|nr:DUF6094 domain-containing protein [Clostridium beijerinckii]UYZ38986.1 DUF6094 domain-containing protein [Clostridium beijerinckii]
MSENVITRKMNSERQWGNEGKLSYFPTARSVVDMEMKLIDFSELENSDISLNIADLSGGEGDQLNWMYQYLQKNNIKAEAYYNELAKERFQNGMCKYPHFNGVSTDIFELRIANKSNRNVNKKVFSIIRNNPPYIWLNKGDRNVRAEMEFFITNSLFDINGGIHIFELPIHQLLEINNLISIINYRYEMRIFKFPKEEFEKFKQVVVICQKRHMAVQDKNRIEQIKADLENDNIPYLDEVADTPAFKAYYNDFKKTPSINLFRNGRVTDQTLFSGLNQVIDELIDADKKSNQVISCERGKPIIELMPGHISQILASGGYNGLMGGLLVKGGSNKVIETRKEVEEDKDVITEVEVLKPYLELTNKRGDILYRNF